MQKLRFYFLPPGISRYIPVAASCFLSVWSVSAQTDTSSLLSGPKSVFEDPVSKPGYTDPFFPKTKRFVPVIHTPTVAPEPVATTQVGELKLKGVSGTAGNRLALINNQTLAVGETGKVKIGQGTLINVQVLEIKERSAVVKIEGEKEPKEIFLPPSF